MPLKERIKIKGSITAVTNFNIKIKIKNAKDCNDCNICDGPGGRIISIPSRPGFSEGDEVEAVIPSSLLSGVSFLIYFVPAFFLLAGFAAGYKISGNAGAVISGVLSMGVAFLIIKLLTYKKLKDFIDITHV